VRLIALFSLAAMVALALQTTLASLLPAAMLMPNLALILAVNLGLRYHTAGAALTAFAIGYATDAFSGNQLGVNALLFTLVFGLTYWFSRSVFSTGAGVGAIAVFGGVFVCDYGNYLASSGWTAPVRLPVGMPTVFVQAIMTTLCAPPIFALMWQARKLVGLRQRGARE
jgi:rod shape-determining protein MreD